MSRKEDRHIKSITARRSDKRKLDLKEAAENKKQKSIFECFGSISKVKNSSENEQPCSSSSLNDRNTTDPEGIVLRFQFVKFQKYIYLMIYFYYFVDDVDETIQENVINEAGAGLPKIDDTPEMIIDVDPAIYLLDDSNNDCKFSIIEKHLKFLNFSIFFQRF